LRSDSTAINRFTSRILKDYEGKTQKSKAAFDRANSFLPGGNSRTTVFWNPYPIYFRSGKGFTIYDLDENVYLDFIGNYTSLIHGHAHPRIMEAMRNAIESGSSIHMPTEREVELAELMCRKFPSLDKIRFTNSGTEATMTALRLARAYTGKDKIMKAEGAYHGTHLSAEVSVHPDVTEIGSLENPNSVPEAGTPASMAKDVIIYPFNNVEVTERIFKRHRDQLAAVIVEPVMRTIPPKEGFLDLLREMTTKNNVLLIYDEVICARISEGGAQQYYDVAPDLTAFGKIFGGGLPFGAFGGRDDIMMLTDPSRQKSLRHEGTFNANPVTLAAGIASAEMLTSEAIGKLNELGNDQRKGMMKTLEESGIMAQLTGVGSLLTMHFTDKEVTDFRSSALAESELNHPLYISLLLHGISTAARIFTALSTPMSKREIDTFVEAFRKSMEQLKPLIKEVAPNLIAV
jgi:glutamate-1-semialdehyde 2,1-aminomutase